ncbi:MAG TPA: 16S rRNA (uracil(1498)-N(3))-methyltransferase [Candidatus Paceibacterota bacterium]|nr:16S rRNA (uracil(1498)-N(3))-methyltransferase [Candidatus Paceibacterota bacterium]
MKKIHRFLVPHLPIEATIDITDKRIVHQVVKVLAMEIGEHLILFTDGGDDVVFSVNAITATRVSLQRLETSPQRSNPSRSVVAAIGIAKGAHFDLIVQKLTEIGVSTVVPLITDRTVKQSVRIDRLQTISDEALELCGGSTRLRITEPLSLKECFERFPSTAIVCDREGEAPLSTLKTSNDPIVMYIGPEGGWSDNERAFYTNSGAHIVTLGSRTLRTETAAIVAAYELLC